MSMEQLKADAKRMGLTFSPNIGYDALLKKVNAARDQEEVSEEVMNTSAKESPFDAAMKLVRVIVIPTKHEHTNYQGEIFTAISTPTGKVTKYVPFDKEWHVPQILLEVIESRHHIKIANSRSRDGKEVYSANVVPTYRVQKLPSLTSEEFEEIRVRQEAQGLDEHFDMEGERIF